MKKAPRKKRYRFVSGHALERLRERIIQLDLDHRLDADLEQWLDSAIEHAIRRGDVEAIMDRHEPAKLADIAKDLGAPAFALVKTNTHEKAEYAEVIVTVMDDVMVTQYRNGRWRDSKFRPLASGLAKVRLRDPVVEVKPEPKPEPMPKKTETQTEPKDFLVTYHRNDAPLQEIVSPVRLKPYLVQLALDAGIDNIRVWREVPMNLQVSVDLKL